jgi:flagellar biosynthesis/type III secretory pathway protein FliH
MSSRARRVTQAAERYDWDAPALPMAALSVAAPEGPAGLGGREGPVSDVGHDDSQNQQRLAELERDAFIKGYAQGERAGGEAAGTRADAMLRRLAQTVEELGSLRNDILQRTERQVVHLSLAIAHRMLQRELNADRGMLLAMARVALDRLGEHTAATIRLHPDDFAIVMSARDGSRASDHVQVVADSVVGRGGCLVQADFGLMDVGLEAQFSEMAHALLDGDAERIAEHAPVHAPVHPLHTVAVHA